MVLVVAGVLAGVQCILRFPQHDADGLARLAVTQSEKTAVAALLLGDLQHVLLHDPVRFEAKQLENADHLVGPAAAEYTRKLIEAIQQSSKATAPAASST